MTSEKTLDYYFRKIWHNIARIYNWEAAKHGITMSAGFALLSIEKEGTPSTKLGPKMGMEPRSLTRMLKALEKNGLIYKKNDKKDKRIVLIFLTEEGKEKRKIAANAVIHFNERLQNQLTENELKNFFSVCRKIDGILEKNNIFKNEEIN